MMVSAEHDPRRAGTIWALNLDEPRSAIQPLVPARFARLGPESAAALEAAKSGFSQAEILHRFEAGRRCYAACVSGRIASYGWVSFDEEFVGELYLRVRLVPGEVYIWDCHTVPEFRRNHLYSALLDYIVRELRADPLCRAWIGADQTNEASQRGIARAGFRAAADLVVARALAMRLVWVQGRPGVPENIVNEVRRVFLGNRDQTWLAAVNGLDKLRPGSSERIEI